MALCIEREIIYICYCQVNKRELLSKVDTEEGERKREKKKKEIEKNVCCVHFS